MLDDSAELRVLNVSLEHPPKHVLCVLAEVFEQRLVLLESLSILIILVLIQLDLSDGPLSLLDHYFIHIEVGSLENFDWVAL